VPVRLLTGAGLAPAGRMFPPVAVDTLFAVVSCAAKWLGAI